MTLIQELLKEGNVTLTKKITNPLEEGFGKTIVTCIELQEDGSITRQVAIGELVGEVETFSTLEEFEKEL